jgi:MFS family permease
LVGLAQFLPGIVLFLVSGHVADRFNRRNLLIICDGGFAVCFALLLAITLHGSVSIVWIFAVLVLLGVVRSFNGPVSRAMGPHLVPPEHFASSVAWASSIFQAATILGPVLGGLIYALAHGPVAVYSAALVFAAVAISPTLKIPAREKPRARTCRQPFHGVWKDSPHLAREIDSGRDFTRSVCGAARRRSPLLPVYAREILSTGPWGLGILRSAPGVGAGIMAIADCSSSAEEKGRGDRCCVRGRFGLCTVLFGIRLELAISLLALFLVGTTDMVSVIVRATLIQVATPDGRNARP